MAPLTLIALALVAQAQAPAQAPARDPQELPELPDQAAPADPVAPADDLPAAAPAPEPPPPPLPAPRPRYGDRGTSDLSLGVGYAQGEFLGALGYRRFFWTAIAPGVEGRVQTGSGTTLGLLLGMLRTVPLRTESVALALTARAGRVLVSDHGDGWGAGGDAGLIVTVAAGVAFEIGYEALRLLPARFCAEFTSCWMRGPVVGLRVLF